MLIRNIYVYGSSNDKRYLKDVYITKEGYKEIQALNTDPLKTEIDEVIDAKGMYTLMPGMLDGHVHGQGGPDFSDLDELSETAGLPVITKALGETGLSYAMATLVSLELPKLKKCLAVIDSYVKNQAKSIALGHTKIVGIHLEGPFIAKNCKGAHAETALQASISVTQFEDIIMAAPNITQWKITLAPDLPGAQTFIQEVKLLEKIKGISVKIFLGHSNPEDSLDIEKAVNSGAVGFTHLGNACQEICCRESRQLEKKDAVSHMVQYVLENPELCPHGVELIVDGMHLSSPFVELVKKTIPHKIMLVTDALGPSGLKSGIFKLGALPIFLEKNTFYLSNEKGEIVMKDGTLPNGEKGKIKSLAGSGSSLAHCMKTYMKWTETIYENEEDKIHSLYTAVVKNPRMTSLSQDAIDHLPDSQNFIMVDNNGKLIMSLCNGLLQQHEPIFRLKKESYFNLFSTHFNISEEENFSGSLKNKIDHN